MAVIMNFKKLLLFLVPSIIQLQAQIPKQEQPTMYEQAPVKVLDFVMPKFNTNSILTACCFSQDAKFMAFGSSNGTVIIDDPQNNASYELSPRIRGIISHLAFSQNNEYLLTYSQTNILARINDIDEQDEQEPVERSLANIMIWKRTSGAIYEAYNSYATDEDTNILKAKIANNGTAVFSTHDGLFILKKGPDDYPQLTLIPDTEGKDIVPFTIEAKPFSQDVSVWYVCNTFIRRGVIARASALSSLTGIPDNDPVTSTLNIFENNRRQLIPFNNRNNRNNAAISEIEKIGTSLFLRADDSSLRIITHDGAMHDIQLPVEFPTISLMHPSEDKQSLLVVALKESQNRLQDIDYKNEKIILCYNAQGKLLWSVEMPLNTDLTELHYRSSFHELFITFEIINKTNPTETKDLFLMISQDPQPLPHALRDRSIHGFDLFSPLTGNYYLHVDQTEDEAKKVWVSFYTTKESNH
jgi:hypothetical protein